VSDILAFLFGMIADNGAFDDLEFESEKHILQAIGQGPCKEGSETCLLNSLNEYRNQYDNFLLFFSVFFFFFFFFFFFLFSFLFFLNTFR